MKEENLKDYKEKEKESKESIGRGPDDGDDLEQS